MTGIFNNLIILIMVNKIYISNWMFVIYFFDIFLSFKHLKYLELFFFSSFSLKIIGDVIYKGMNYMKKSLVFSFFACYFLAFIHFFFKTFNPSFTLSVLYYFFFIFFLFSFYLFIFYSFFLSSLSLFLCYL